MDTNEHEGELLHRELVFQIVGAAMEVINALGHGLNEKPYENALVVELQLRGRRCDQQARFPVVYKGHQVAEYIPDLIVDGTVVVDAKVIDAITDIERGQMLNYLRLTRKRVGVILNFRHSKLRWERLVL